MRWAVLALAALAHLPLAAQPVAPITVTGSRQPGGLLTVATPTGWRSLLVDGVPTSRAAPGLFLVGVPRDAGPSIRLQPDAGQPGQEYVVPIVPRHYRIQRLPALGVTDTPSEEWQARRDRERASMNAARLKAVAMAGFGSGWQQSFIRPAIGRISGVYGSQRYYGGLARNPHLGLDIAAPTGTAVVAPADGVVRLAAGPYLLEGNVVLLDHGGGLVTSYMHLSSIAVRAGDVVRQGDRLGAIGSTGRSTGPHLHWGMGLLHRDPSGFRETRLDPALLLTGG